MIPDSFEVIVYEGEKISEKWDITAELLENGKSRRNFTDASLNIDVEFIFMHKDLFDLFKDDRFLQKLVEVSHDANDLSRSNTVETVGGLNDLSLVLGILTLLIGLIGLAVKLRASDQTSAGLSRQPGSASLLGASVLVS